MQYKQAQVLLSDFLLKCENEGIALPADPLDAVIAAVRALSHETKHEVGRAQMAAAMAAMRQQYGVVKQPSPSRSKYQAADSSAGAASDNHGAPVSPPPAPRKRMAGTSMSKVQQDVVSKRAKRGENQPLVDQLVQLGEFELESGRTQRGLTRMRAAKQLRDADEVITSGAQARQLDRVGQSAAAKVDAILHGGLENAMREYQ